MKRLFPLLIVFAGLACCQKPVDFEIPEPKARIVIDAKIFAGDSVFAQLGTTQFYFDPEDDEDPDTTYEVLLFENGSPVEKLEPSYSRTYGYYYTGAYVPKEGKRYRVEASKEGLEPAHGSCTVPRAVEVRDVSWDTLSTGEVQMGFSITDPPAPNDAYMLRVLVPDTFKNFRPSYAFFESLDPVIKNFEHPDLLRPEQFGKVGQVFLFDDDSFNGQEKQVRLYLFLFQSKNWAPEIVDHLTICLYSISEDLYQHEESKYMFYETSLGIFSEPARVSSNVTNGLGIVAGASANKLRLEL